MAVLQKRPPKGGFTLIELLVVLAIIGLLSAVVLASLNASREKSRDAKRLSNARELQKALELYVSEAGLFPQPGPPGPPSDDSCDDPPDWIPNLVNAGFLPLLPLDPINANGLCYWYRSDGADYKVAVPLEREENQANYGANDGGHQNDDDWFEVFTPGGKGWRPNP